ncbi:hypothetical protein GCM10027162_55160 [Streptomyces incanus]
MKVNIGFGDQRHAESRPETGVAPGMAGRTDAGFMGWLLCRGGTLAA